MTDNAVNISIAIKVEGVVMEIQKLVLITTVEETIHGLTLALSQQVLCGVI
jgi:hypothetical protein